MRENKPSRAAAGISDTQLEEILSVFGISLDRDQLSKVRQYIALILQWNQAMSLTTVTEPIEIVRRHFGESMFASNLLPVENCRLADVGTGAGFPGLALKIACPGVHVILIESNKKKCAFLSEVIRKLEFEEVEVWPERFEQVRPERVSAHIITARAVGDFKRLLKWSEGALANRGHIVLWVGGEDSTRISGASGWTWQPAVHIPDSRQRFILIGRPIRPSSSEN
jgi:16S rRNA (guanine527-N7)-methyltransferase